MIYSTSVNFVWKLNKYFQYTRRPSKQCIGFEKMNTLKQHILKFYIELFYKVIFLKFFYFYVF